MSMQALDLGLPKASLLVNPKGKELLYHLQSVSKDNAKKVSQLKALTVADNDHCEIYDKGRLIATTSTQELAILIRAATYDTFKLAEVRTENEVYYAALESSLFDRKYAGVLTDAFERPVAFVQSINGTYWAVDGKRLVHLEVYEEEVTTTEEVHLNPQECVKYINKHPELLEGAKSAVVLFK